MKYPMLKALSRRLADLSELVGRLTLVLAFLMPSFFYPIASVQAGQSTAYSDQLCRQVFKSPSNSYFPASLNSGNYKPLRELSAEERQVFEQWIRSKEATEAFWTYYQHTFRNAPNTSPLSPSDVMSKYWPSVANRLHQEILDDEAKGKTRVEAKGLFWKYENSPIMWRRQRARIWNERQSRRGTGKDYLNETVAAYAIMFFGFFIYNYWQYDKKDLTPPEEEPPIVIEIANQDPNAGNANQEREAQRQQAEQEMQKMQELQQQLQELMAQAMTAESAAEPTMPEMQIDQVMDPTEIEIEVASVEVDVSFNEGDIDSQPVVEPEAVEPVPAEQPIEVDPQPVAEASGVSDPVQPAVEASPAPVSQGSQVSAQVEPEVQEVNTTTRPSTATGGWDSTITRPDIVDRPPPRSDSDSIFIPQEALDELQINPKSKTTLSQLMDWAHAERSEAIEAEVDAAEAVADELQVEIDTAEQLEALSPVAQPAPKNEKPADDRELTERERLIKSISDSKDRVDQRQANLRAAIEETVTEMPAAKPNDQQPKDDREALASYLEKAEADRKQRREQEIAEAERVKQQLEEAAARLEAEAEEAERKRKEEQERLRKLAEAEAERQRQLNEQREAERQRQVDQQRAQLEAARQKAEQAAEQLRQSNLAEQQRLQNELNKMRQQAQQRQQADKQRQADAERAALQQHISQSQQRSQQAQQQSREAQAQAAQQGQQAAALSVAQVTSRIVDDMDRSLKAVLSLEYPIEMQNKKLEGVVYYTFQFDTSSEKFVNVKVLPDYDPGDSRYESGFVTRAGRRISPNDPDYAIVMKNTERVVERALNSIQLPESYLRSMKAAYNNGITTEMGYQVRFNIKN